MKHKPLFYAILMVGSLSLPAGAAFAQQQRPPAPDFSSMAATLNVPEAALMKCLGDRPKQGHRPERPNASKVSSCLDTAGYSVTEKSVYSALATAGPPKR